MSDHRMTAADAQAMIEEVLEFERVGGPVEEATSLDEAMGMNPRKLATLAASIMDKAKQISSSAKKLLTDPDKYAPQKDNIVNDTRDIMRTSAMMLRRLGVQEDVEPSGLTEDAVQSAFDHEVKPWLRRELEKVMGQLDNKMQGIMRGQFPEKRMEYGITRYAPMSMGPKDFLKSLRTPYLYWRGQIRGMVEAEEPEGEPLDESYLNDMFRTLLGRVEDDITKLRNAVAKESTSDIAAYSANLLSHVGDVIGYFVIWSGNNNPNDPSVRNLVKYAKKYRVRGV